MLIEGWVKCLCPENTSGVSGVNSVAANSNTSEVNGDHFFKRIKTPEKNINASTLLLWSYPSVQKPPHSNPTQNKGNLAYMSLDILLWNCVHV